MKSGFLAVFSILAIIFLAASPSFGQDAGSANGDLNLLPPSLEKRVSDLEKADAVKVEIHGFAETDVIGDDTRSFTEVVGNNPVVRPGSFAGDNGWLQTSTRNSRIDFLASTLIDGWKTKGYLEADFFGYDPAPVYAGAPAGAAGTNTEINFFVAPTLRIRHAYLDAQKDGWDFMMGQYWTLFGWNMDYVLASVEVQPVMGSLYERTPRLGVMKTLKQGNDWSLQIALDGEKPEQRDSMVPNINGGIRFALDGWKGRFAYATAAPSVRSLSVGISGTLRNYAYPTAAGGFSMSNTWGQALAVDALVPLLPFETGKDAMSVVAVGEWTAGSGYADALNGYSGGMGPYAASGVLPNLDAGIAGYDQNGNFTLVQLQSWNGQLQVHLPPSIGAFFTFGYGESFSPNAAGLMGSASNGTNLSATSQAKVYNDDMVLFANVMQDLTSNIRLGLEYARFDTHYEALAVGSDAIDHRVQFSCWYRF